MRPVDRAVRHSRRRVQDRQAGRTLQGPCNFRLIDRLRARTWRADPANGGSPTRHAVRRMAASLRRIGTTSGSVPPAASHRGHVPVVPLARPCLWPTPSPSRAPWSPPAVGRRARRASRRRRGDSPAARPRRPRDRDRGRPYHPPARRRGPPRGLRRGRPVRDRRDGRHPARGRRRADHPRAAVDAVARGPLVRRAGRARRRAGDRHVGRPARRPAGDAPRGGHDRARRPARDVPGHGGVRGRRGRRPVARARLVARRLHRVRPPRGGLRGRGCARAGPPGDGHRLGAGLRGDRRRRRRLAGDDGRDLHQHGAGGAVAAGGPDRRRGRRVSRLGAPAPPPGADRAAVRMRQAARRRGDRRRDDGRAARPGAHRPPGRHRRGDPG